MLEDLQVLLKKEISAMREILANMHQEELSLMIGDQNALRVVLDERSKLLAQLSDLRLARMEISKNLEDSTELAIHCEILSLRDQILALVERMNFQNLRNVFLFNQGIRPGEIPTSNPMMQRPKKKGIVATYTKYQE